MNEFEKLRLQDRRLRLLQLLENEHRYSAHESRLQEGLDIFSHAVSADQVRTDVAWLEEQGLVKSRDVGGMVIAELTRRGLDVGRGRTIVPGVKRPEPGDW